MERSFSFEDMIAGAAEMMSSTTPAVPQGMSISAIPDDIAAPTMPSNMNMSAVGSAAAPADDPAYRARLAREKEEFKEKLKTMSEKDKEYIIYNCAKGKEDWWKYEAMFEQPITEDNIERMIGYNMDYMSAMGKPNKVAMEYDIKFVDGVQIAVKVLSGWHTIRELLDRRKCEKGFIQFLEESHMSVWQMRGIDWKRFEYWQENKCPLTAESLDRYLSICSYENEIVELGYYRQGYVNYCGWSLHEDRTAALIAHILFGIKAKHQNLGSLLEYLYPTPGGCTPDHTADEVYFKEAYAYRTKGIISKLTFADMMLINTIITPIVRRIDPSFKSIADIISFEGLSSECVDMPMPN